MRKIHITVLVTFLLLTISNIMYGGALNLKKGQRIRATIVEPIYVGDVFMGFSFKNDRINIKKEEVPIFNAIDADLQSEKNSDTIILIHSYRKNNRLIDISLINGGSNKLYFYDDKGDVTTWYPITDIDSIEENSRFDFLRFLRSEENIAKTISSWNFDSIADMLLYSGSYYRGGLGYLLCDRLILSSGHIANWERLTINNVFFWSSPSLIEQMPLEFKQDSMVKVIYKRDISNRILELEKEKAPIEDIRSRKFWRYDKKNNTIKYAPK